MIRDRILNAWLERARAGVADSPEGHCADLADVVIGILSWILRPSGRGGNGTPAERGRESRSAVTADRRLPACHREAYQKAR